MIPSLSAQGTVNAAPGSSSPPVLLPRHRRPWWANGLFMLGLLAIGIALIAAISGVLMLAMMWLAEVPFAQFTSAGEPTGSPNPLADSHYIYAIVLIVLAATYAGTTRGLGRTWARLPFINRNRWAL